MNLPNNAPRYAVAAEEAREHLQNLRRLGVPQATLAAATGLSERHIAHVMNGHAVWLRPDTADRILVVGISALETAREGKIGSRESKRLVQEMVNAGFGRGWIGRQLGCTKNNNCKIGDRILASRALKIRQLHDRLWWANETGWKQISHGSIRIGVPLRSVCKCYGCDPKTEANREAQQRLRARKATAA